jgi:sugar/nucleoside kinase (ribokinase family)
MKVDFLVVANPVWEVSWMVNALPLDRFDPDDRIPRFEDGGGSALNSACALACAGWRVVAVGRVGDDPGGRASIAALERRGVTARIEVAAGRTTKRNHVYVERATAATAFEATLPPLCAEPWDDPPPDLEESGFLLLDRLAAPAVGWLAARHGRTGLRNGLNRNTPGRHGLGDQRLREAMPYLDYLQIPEEANVPLLVDAPLQEQQRIHRPRPFPTITGPQIDSILGSGVRMLVRTQGARGAIIHSDRGGAVPIPAFATEVIDPTGAGDAFAAGVLDLFLRRGTIEDAGRQGADWAARACRYLGARGWLDHEPPHVDGNPRPEESAR